MCQVARLATLRPSYSLPVVSPRHRSREPGPEELIPQSADSSGWERRRWVVIASLLLIPIVAFALPHLYTINIGQGHIDPFIYTGYADSYGDLLARFGRTYYSNRVTSIWPNAVAIDLFGVAHYEIVRTVQYLMVGVGAFLAMPRRIAIPARSCAAVGCMASIELATTFGTDYPAGTVVAYSFLAVGCLLHWRTPWGALAVGVFFSLALNAHEGTLYVAIPVLTATAITRLQHGQVKSWLAMLGCWLAGLVVVQLGLSIAMANAYGWTESNYAFQLTAVRYAIGLAGGGAAGWDAPLLNPNVPILLSLIVTAVVTWLFAIRAMRDRCAQDRTDDEPVLGSSAFAPSIWWLPIATTLCCVLILISDLIIHTGIAAWPYAIATILPLSSIAPWLLVFSRRASFRGSHLLPYGLAALACLIPILGSFDIDTQLPMFLLWIVFIATALVLSVAALVLARKRIAAPLAAFASACAVLVFCLGPLASAHLGGNQYQMAVAGDQIAGSPPQLDGREVQQLAPQFQHYVTSHIPPGTDFVVWYPESPLGLNSVQSTLLYASTCLACRGNSAAFPGIKGREYALLTRSAYVVVLTASADEQQVALKALQRVDELSFTPVRAQTLNARDGDTPIYVTLLEVRTAATKPKA